jgi:FkbM family methyltransferase
MQNKDRLRTIIRRAINVNGKLYQSGARSLNAFHVTRSQGIETYRWLYREPEKNEEYRSVKFKGYPYPILFRPHVSTDIYVLVNNLIRAEYGNLPNNVKPGLIIDAGSYIGDVSIYYLNRYKGCKIVAIEPNPDNHALAASNLLPYSSRVRLINKGLWSSNTTLYLAGSYSGAAVVDVDSGNGFIECTDIKTIIRENNIEKIDIIKLDIEGAEKEVILNNSKDWLSITRIVIVEFHGEDIKDRCITTLKEFGFHGYQYRSLYYFVRERGV